MLDSFFSVKEGITLLTMKAGTAMLLKKVIFDALHRLTVAGEKVQDPISALDELGIQQMDPDQAELVLALRTDLT